MSRTLLRAATLVAFCAALAAPLTALYVRIEASQVPVARLAANLERELAKDPKRDDVHVQLARLYGMAYAINADEVPAVSIISGRPEEIWFGHEPNLIPYKATPASDAERRKASRAYLDRALRHYRSALDINPNSLLARLGFAWATEQSGDKAAAIAEYRRVIERAWPKERDRRSVNLGERFYTPEAAGYLIPLLDAQRDAEEIAELRRRSERLEALPRPVTPIAIPLRDGMTPRTIVDLDAQVSFDADGSGQRRRWTWISPDAGWLVYDAGERGLITSALQWFGSVSFWLFWNNGYQALAALDDDGDGELKGRELRYLRIWQDADGDGISDPGEVRSLESHGIAALVHRHVAGDNLLTIAESPRGVRFLDGRIRSSYDVILRPAWSVSAPVPQP